tara:strand:+ start:1148 stop:2158 length:1011 start_codon:yes stop_codon:yes gene_type:complete
MGMIIATIVAVLLSELGISAGYHRLYSHRAYKTNKIVELFLMVFGTLGTQGSVIKWSHDHRVHHKYVDTDRDPYSIKKGFWYAHIFWIFEKDKPIDKKIVADLMRNKLLIFQQKYYGVLLVLFNVIIVMSFGFIFKDFFGAFVFGVLIRTFFIHHLTWFINSLAHTWGSKVYSKEHTAVNNYVLSILTFGEGYHNYHHTFPSDYRNGVKWYHFDPSKWLIWTLSRFRLVKNSVSFNKNLIKYKLLIEDKKNIMFKLKQDMHSKNELLKLKLQELHENIGKNIVSLNNMRKEYKLRRKTGVGKENLKQLRLDIKHRAKTLKRDWKAWQLLVNLINLK